MMRIRPAAAMATLLTSVAFLSAFRVSRTPDDEFASIVSAFLGRDLENSWEGLEKLPLITWAPLPPTSLKNCLPDLGCYTREGRLAIGGGTMTVVATGARTIVTNLYIRNAGGAAGRGGSGGRARKGRVEPPSGAVSRKQRREHELVRVTGKQVNPGYLAVQVKCKGKPCEGFVLSRGEKLPPLQPNQLALFSEQCDAGSERKVVSTSKPPELIAGAIKTLLPPAAGPASYDWKVLVALPTGIAWNGDGPKPGNMSYKGDPGPLLQTGQVTLGGREFSVAASGTTAHVTAIYFDEMGTHPKGEHMLGALYDKGLTVTLVRCGPVYTESTNNWYSATSSAYTTRDDPAVDSLRRKPGAGQLCPAAGWDAAGPRPARPEPGQRAGVDDWTLGCAGEQRTCKANTAQFANLGVS